MINKIYIQFSTYIPTHISFQLSPGHMKETDKQH